MARQTQRNEFLKYEFAPEEIAAMARELGQANQKVDQFTQEKKQVVKDFDAQIEREKANILVLSQKVTNQYEMRSLDCLIFYDSPIAGQKSIVRKDTGEVVKIERMTGDELQEELPLDNNSPTSATTELAKFHDEAVQEEHTWHFAGLKAKLALRVFRTRFGWHWMFGMADGEQEATSTASDKPVATRFECIFVGAKALHDAVLMAFRRNREKLSAEQVRDARDAMDWLTGISRNPDSIADYPKPADTGAVA